MTVDQADMKESFRNLGHELVKLGLAETIGEEAEVGLTTTRDN